MVLNAGSFAPPHRLRASAACGEPGAANQTPARCGATRAGLVTHMAHCSSDSSSPARNSTPVVPVTEPVAAAKAVPRGCAAEAEAEASAEPVPSAPGVLGSLWPWPWGGLLAKKSGNFFSGGYFVLISPGSPHVRTPHGAYVRRARRNRIGRHGGETEQLTTRTARAMGSVAGAW